MANDLDSTVSFPECYAEILPHLDVAQTLAEKVAVKVDDRSYTYDTILDKLNTGLRWISGKYMLPDLEKFEDVETDPGVNNIPLPRDYQKKLRWAHNVTHNREVKVYPSTVQLLRWFSQLDQTGRIIGIAVKGRSLFYQRIPSAAETIRINYWRYPERIDMRTEKVECIPEHLVEPLLVSYACREIFSEIEDGLEEEKLNTKHYAIMLTSALKELDLFLGPEKRIPVDIGTEVDWEAYLSG
jgi:hypothetical protein